MRPGIKKPYMPGATPQSFKMLPAQDTVHFSGCYKTEAEMKAQEGEGVYHTQIENGQTRRSAWITGYELGRRTELRRIWLGTPKGDAKARQAAEEELRHYENKLIAEVHEEPWNLIHSNLDVEEESVPDPKERFRFW